MNYEELLELLEIDAPSDFVFFEQYAELTESDADVSENVLSKFFSEADPDVLSELTENYFEDILKYIPDDTIDVFNLLTQIGQTLTALAEGAKTKPDNLFMYAEEYFRFRSWYTTDSDVHCVKDSDGTEIDLPMAEAIALYRLESLESESYRYDFTDALDYTLEEYIIPLRDLADIDDDDDHDDESLHRHQHEYGYADDDDDDGDEGIDDEINHEAYDDSYED